MPTQDAGKGRQANGYGKETHEYDPNGKDALAHIWDTVFGDRHAGTNETQDRAHSAIVFLVTLALITSIASLGAWLWHDHASYREDHILVPAATYADDQTESVEGQLKDMGFVYSISNVLGVVIPDVPGGLNQVLQILTEEDVNVEYMYAFQGGRNISGAYMIFKVADENKASAVLTGRGIKLVDQDALEAM